MHLSASVYSTFRYTFIETPYRYGAIKLIKFTSEKNVFIPVNHSMIKIEICADFREILGKSVTIFCDRYVLLN